MTLAMRKGKSRHVIIRRMLENQNLTNPLSPLAAWIQSLVSAACFQVLMVLMEVKTHFMGLQGMDLNTCEWLGRFCHLENRQVHSGGKKANKILAL
jgi:hypothetical protein